MKSNNVVREKSYAFALEIIAIYKYLCEEKKEYILSKQLLRLGTSIGTNIEEAIGGQSIKDFYAKLTISCKEAREAHYWLRLLTDSDYLGKEKSAQLIRDVKELLRIIGSIQKTIRNS